MKILLSIVAFLSLISFDSADPQNPLELPPNPEFAFTVGYKWGALECYKCENKGKYAEPPAECQKEKCEKNRAGHEFAACGRVYSSLTNQTTFTGCSFTPAHCIASENASPKNYTWTCHCIYSLCNKKYMPTIWPWERQDDEKVAATSLEASKAVGASNAFSAEKRALRQDDDGSKTRRHKSSEAAQSVSRRSRLSMLLRNKGGEAEKWERMR